MEKGQPSPRLHKSPTSLTSLLFNPFPLQNNHDCCPYWFRPQRYVFRSGDSFSTNSSLALSRSSIAGSSVRSISTKITSKEYEQQLLVAQRRNRPTSPHLTIYQPQLTAIMSSLHRISGVGLAAGFYALTCGMAVSSVLDLGLTSDALISFFIGLPVGLQVAAKALATYPIVYHSANGIRHIIWDFGKQLTVKGVYRTGYAVTAVTLAVGTYYSFFA